MKGFFKRASLCVIAGLTSVSVLAGCGGGGNANSATDVEIAYWIGGYGQEYMDHIVAAFNEKYPEYYAYLSDPSKNATTVANRLNLKDEDTVDIYCNQLGGVRSYLDTMLPLNELLDETMPDESVTLRQKYNARLLDSLTEADGTVRMLGYAGSTAGIIYNAKIIDGKSYTVPRTSDELQMLCIDLNGNGIKPFIHFQDSNIGYYTYLLKAWQAQYSGMDYYKNNWLQLKDEEGNLNSKEAMLSETDGRKAALIAMGKVVTPEFCYRGSNSNKFTISQTYFLQGEAAMMVNGSWLEYEMSNSSSENMDMRMMRIPVISSIIDKCTTITDDETLCEVVDSVDAVIDGGVSPLTGNADALVDVNGYEISEADWKTVYDARKIIYNNGSEHSMFINKYSNAQEGAKKFVQFYFSDEGHRYFIEDCHSIPLVTFGDGVEIDTTGWSGFTKAQFEDAQKSTWLCDGIAQSPIFTKTSTHMYGTLAITNKLSATNSNDRKTAAQLWEDFKKDVNNKWADWTKAAGI